jgi:UDP-N-acetylmuramyl pentapeptide phosphotransferase/UDP-N-acetylglucosamine-1-phosphate transferase
MIGAIIVFTGSFCLGLAAMAMALRLFSGYAAAHPVERSNHVGSTPQVGGLVLVPLFMLAMIAVPALGLQPTVFSSPSLLAALLILYATGLVDDRMPLGALPKLALQLVASAIAVFSLGDVLQAMPVPLAVSAPLAFVTLVVLVNLANFIDGLDLMAVSTIGTPALSFGVLGVGGFIAAAYAPPAAVLVGLLAAFAFFNRPKARAFLGDAGSLPFGLLVGVMTVVLATTLGPAAALLLPAYLLCDGLVTIARRLFKGENILAAHSSHVYQRAYRGGRGVYVVVLAATATGLVSGLALLSTAQAGLAWQVAAVLAVLVFWWLVSAWLLRSLRA